MFSWVVVSSSLLKAVGLRLLVIASALDFVSTVVGLACGFSESNPIFSLVGGAFPFFLYYLGLTVVVYFVLCKCPVFMCPVAYQLAFARFDAFLGNFFLLVSQ